jgi:hypothetical protein
MLLYFWRSANQLRVRKAHILWRWDHYVDQRWNTGADTAQSIDVDNITGQEMNKRLGIVKTFLQWRQDQKDDYERAVDEIERLIYPENKF